MPKVFVKLISYKSRIDGYKQKLDENSREAMNEVAELLVDDIKANWSGYYPPASEPGEAPAIRTGTLDLSVMPTDLSDDGGHLSINVRASAPYADFLEYGTYKMAARPFMRPAVQRIKEQFGAVLARVVKDIDL